jgi:hypothetical protein
MPSSTTKYPSPTARLLVRRAAARPIVDGDVYAWSFISDTVSTLALGADASLSSGDPVTYAGAAEGPQGRLLLTVRRATAGEPVIGVVDAPVVLRESARRPGSWLAERLDRAPAHGDHLAIVIRGLVAVPAGGLEVGDLLLPGVSGGLQAADDADALPRGTAVGHVVGTAADGRLLVYVDPH